MLVQPLNNVLRDQALQVHLQQLASHPCACFLMVTKLLLHPQASCQCLRYEQKGRVGYQLFLSLLLGKMLFRSTPYPYLSHSHQPHDVRLEIICHQLQQGHMGILALKEAGNMNVQAFCPLWWRQTRLEMGGSQPADSICLGREAKNMQRSLTT